MQHFKQRASERYRVELNHEGRRKIVSDIKNGKAEFVRSQSNRVTHWKVNVDGVTMYVLYDKERHSLITALPARGSPKLI